LGRLPKVLRYRNEEGGDLTAIVTQQKGPAMNLQKFIDRLNAQLDVSDDYHAVPSTWMLQNSNIRSIVDEMQQELYGEIADKNRIHCPD
jgi:hypothetical protein